MFRPRCLRRWAGTLLTLGFLALAPGCGGGGSPTPAPTPTPVATAPVFTAQPMAETAVEGGSASFGVMAQGNGTLTYQWKKGAADLSGKTAATLTFNPVALTDAGSYSVLVTNTLTGTSQSVLSNTAALTVNPRAITPVIGTQPAASQTTLEGGSASFSVVASGNGILTYQWQKGGADLYGKTAATFTLNSVALVDAGSYTVRVTNSLNGTTATALSSASVLAVYPTATTPAITSQPASQTVLEGASASFSVMASANGTLTYQWRKDGTDLIGQTAATLALNPVVLADAGSYTVLVTNSLNGTVASTTSSSAVLTVTAPSATHFGVTGYPSPTTPGASHSFTVRALDTFGNTATGYAGTVHFTSSDTAAILPGDYAFGGSDNGSHSFTATLNTSGTQALMVIDTVSATLTGSQIAITVGAQVPAIQTQPQSTIVRTPDGATFTVSATGTGTLTYQWRKNGTDISGETGDNLTVGPTDLREISAIYSVVVTDGGGASVTSENATLTVMAPEPTYAGDPVAVPSRPLTALPSYNVGTAFPHGAFRLGYDEALKNPAWTAYANFKFTAAFATGTRTFLADDRLAAPLVTDADYSGSGWTRGHQVMLSDLAYRYGSQAGTDTCRLSNVAPQETDHNNNFWNHLEQAVGGSFTGTGGAWVGGLADTFNRIWIYTGPTFEANAPLLPGTVAPVRIPSGFWKVVVREAAPGQPKVVAVLTPNKAGLAMSATEIQKYTTSVARIEALTGLDLFPAPTSSLPATFKTAVDVRGWGGSFEVTGKPNVHMIAPSWDISSPVGTTLTFQGDATSSNSSVASTTWTFGDGQAASGTATSHSYAAGGTYSVTFTAMDGLGVSNAVTRVVTVTGGNQAPTVTGLPASDSTPVDTAKDLAFTVSDDVAPLAVTFTASSSDQSIVPDSGLSFTGTMASQVLHVVPAAGATGTVTVTLRVTDGDLATTTKTLTLSVGTAPPPTPLSENFTWAGTGTTYATGDFTLATGSWHFVTTLSVSTDASDAKNGGQGLRMKALAGSAVSMNFDHGDATTPVSSVSVAYGVYKSDETNSKTATFSLYYSNDQGGTWTKIGNSVTAGSNTLTTAPFSGLTLTGPIRFKLAVDGTPTARLNLDDFLVQ